MPETINLEKVYRELMLLRKDVDVIKSQVIEDDTLMTDEEEERYKKAMKELEEGKTISLEDLKKELGK